MIEVEADASVSEGPAVSAALSDDACRDRPLAPPGSLEAEFPISQRKSLERTIQGFKQ